MSFFQVPEKLYGIIGKPLGHSLSPVVHNWAFTQLGLPNVYFKWEVEPKNIHEFMEAFRTLPIHGLSVTIPHKKAIQKYVDKETDTAEQIGAVNTLYWEEEALVGENTDVAGFIAPLEERNMSPGTAMVLGAGGAARAVLAGLKRLGVEEIQITARKPERASELAKEFDVQAISWEERTHYRPECIINATPVGMQGKLENRSPWPEEHLPDATCVVYDLVYNPVETRLLRQAKEAGCEVITGLGMFVYQAREQFKIWTGKKFDSHQAASLLMNYLT